MGKITPGEAGGFTYAGKAQEYQAAPSQAHRRSGICVGLLLTARIRRAALLPATLKRVVILPKHRQLFSQFIFVHLTPDIFRNLLLILSHRIIAAVSAVRLDVSNIVLRLRKYFASGNTSPTASSIPRHLSPTTSRTPSSPRLFSHWKKFCQLALSSFMPSCAPRTSRYPSSATPTATRIETFSYSPPQFRFK